MKSNFINLKNRFPVTFWLIIITTFIYLLQVLGQATIGDVITYFGAKYGPYIDAGQVWRLVTPIFLHGGIIHILSNMMSLFFVGPLVERLFGARNYLIIYMVSGIMGNIFSYLFNPMSFSVGASTSIFGLFGALLMIRQIYGQYGNLRAQFNSIVMVVIINLIITFTSAGIDVWGHIGGLIGGFLIALSVGIPHSNSMPPVEKKYSIPAIIGLSLVLIITVVKIIL